MTAAAASTARRTVVAELARVARLEEQAKAAGGGSDVAWRRTLELRQEYRRLVPVVALSRCPFTGAVLELPFDPDDLDSPYWDHDAPVRPGAPTPVTFFAMTGAVRLGTPVASAPFLCRPGPEAPYVLPRLLEDDRIGAVVSAIPIGPHQGFAIAYFARHPAPDLARANTWGTADYWFVNADGDTRWHSMPEWDDHRDFDLAPWIERRSLWWIASGDADLVLLQSVDGCPYLELPGRRSPLLLRDGVVL